MKPTLHKHKDLNEDVNKVIITKDAGNLLHFGLKTEEIEYIEKKKEAGKIVSINRLKEWIFIYFIDDAKESTVINEKCRQAGDKIQSKANTEKMEFLAIIDAENKSNETLAFLEGLLLGNYQFLKYKSQEEAKPNSLKEVRVYSNKIKEDEFSLIHTVADAAIKARDLVNEPVSYLTAEKLAEEIENRAKASGAKVEIMNKRKIESLKMGGLLAVNRGSIDPPTFTVVEWKPNNAINEKPYIFVGKGVVFDTGGMNIKPGNHMNDMKCDMAGAACASMAICAIAEAKLPVYTIALIPATDNRPDGKAYVPGDVINMHSGKTVEVLNTDAEGRLIMADALSYAKKYNPELVIDIATLTGSAHAAIGKHGIVAMGAKLKDQMELLKKSGDNVYERIAEFPFWDEYGEDIKSEVADIKNIGSRYAGAITAGKFLEHFIDYPWIHLDIAGPAFYESKDSYRTKGGTGMGVRLLFDFIKNLAKND
jgi:leucyl aminopeptidase